MNGLLTLILKSLLIPLLFMVSIRGYAGAQDLSNATGYDSETQIVKRFTLRYPMESALQERLIQLGYKPETTCFSWAYLRNKQTQLNLPAIVVSDRTDCGPRINDPKLILAIPQINAPFKYLFAADRHGNILGGPVGGFSSWRTRGAQRLSYAHIEYFCQDTYPYGVSEPVYFACDPIFGANGSLDSISLH